jgi:protein-disulfide isomerase
MPGLRHALALAAAALLAASPAFAAPAKPAAKAAGAKAPVKARWPAAPGDMSLGNPNAPVHVVEYLSLTCPHCAHFNAETYPAFKAKYVDTGRVYYTVRELLTAPANVAAAGFLLARCGDGSHYFPIVDAVFKSQSRWQEGSIKPIFVEIAKANGISEDQFDACIADEKAQAALEARINYAVNTDHVNGTPTFFINGVQLPNGEVPDLAALDAAIAKALKAPAKAPAKGGR